MLLIQVKFKRTFGHKDLVKTFELRSCWSRPWCELGFEEVARHDLSPFSAANTGPEFAIVVVRLFHAFHDATHKAFKPPPAGRFFFSSPAAICGEPSSSRSRKSYFSLLDRDRAAL
jgi:hypothetical protein